MISLRMQPLIVRPDGGDSMLIIRREQMELMSRSAFPRKLQQWAREFRTELPAETQGYSNTQMLELLASGSTAADRYGFTEDAIKKEYLSFILRTGAREEGRPAAPWMRDILDDPALTPTAKMDRIAALIPDPNEEAQDRIALAEIRDDDSGPAAAPEPDDEPDLAVDPRFIVNLEPESAQELSEMEW